MSVYCTVCLFSVSERFIMNAWDVCVYFPVQAFIRISLTCTGNISKHNLIRILSTSIHFHIISILYCFKYIRIKNKNIYNLCYIVNIKIFHYFIVMYNSIVILIILNTSIITIRNIKLLYIG